jgi:hypothetical protein
VVEPHQFCEHILAPHSTLEALGPQVCAQTDHYPLLERHAENLPFEEDVLSKDAVLDLV